MVSESDILSKISFKECLHLIRFYFYFTITKMQHQNYKKSISKLFLGQRVKDILFDILVVKALSCKAMTKFYCKGCIATIGKIPRGG